MLSHTHKCIFVHIRKNAGGSIIRDFSNEDSDIPDRGYGTNGTRDPRWSKDSYPGYIVFAVARNPWSRFISGWKWLCERPYPAKGNLGPEYYRRTSLKEILETLPKELHEDSHDYRHLFWSHLDMLSEKDGRIVADVILRFENLDADYERLCRRISKPYTKLRRTNRSTHAPYWTYYDDETREMVGDLFKNDIEYFGYKFESTEVAP
jgi:chondroitin 4-sulfotransferase 11